MPALTHSPPATAAWTADAFGMTIASDFELPATTPTDAVPPGAVRLELATPTTVDAAWSGLRGRRAWPLAVDGSVLFVEPGVAGDFLLRQPERAIYHVDGEGGRVLCAPLGEHSGWQRVLLDTVLWTTALVRGHEALHGAAVRTDAGVVGLLAGSGAGKTTLALELVRQGAQLVADDVLVLERTTAGFLVHPGPPVANVPLSHPLLDELPADAELARFGDEAWVALRVATEPDVLRALVLLDRTPGAATAMEPARLNGFQLRHFALTHGLLPDREAARFSLCSDLVESVPVLLLRAGLDVGAADLAAMVLEAMPA